MISLAFDEDVSVTAGIGGFLVFFFLAIALWLLMRNMFARLRRMRYRELARIDAELQAKAAREGGDEAAGQDPSGRPSPDGGPDDEGDSASGGQRSPRGGADGPQVP